VTLHVKPNAKRLIRVKLLNCTAILGKNFMIVVLLQLQFVRIGTEMELILPITSHSQI